MRLLAALLLLLPALLLSSTGHASDRLYLYTENFPPYNMSSTGRAYEHNGENVDGLCTELVKAMLAETQLDYVIKLRNWDYGYSRAMEKPNHGIFCVHYTEDRAPKFKWVGPLTTNQRTLFGPAGTNLRINRLSDARGLTIGGYRNDVMAEYLKEQGLTVSELDSDDLNPKRLELGQIDLWIADRLAGPYIASQQDVEGLEPLYRFEEGQLYLGMNKQTPDAVIQTLEEALRRIQQNGIYEAITDKY